MAKIIAETQNYRNPAHVEYNPNKAFVSDIKRSPSVLLKTLALGTGTIMALGLVHHFAPEMPLLGNAYDFSHNWLVNAVPGISHSADKIHEGILSLSQSVGIPHAGDIIDKNFILGEEVVAGVGVLNIPRRLAGRSIQRKASEKFVGVIKQHMEPVNIIISAGDQHLASRVPDVETVHPDLRKAHQTYAIGMALAGMFGAGAIEEAVGGPTDVSFLGLNDILPLIELAYGVSAGDPTRKMEKYERFILYPLFIAAPVLPADFLYGGYAIAKRLLTKESSGSIMNDIQHLQQLYPTTPTKTA